MQPLPDIGGLDGKACITLGLQLWQHHEQLWLECGKEERQQALQGMLQGCDLVAEAAENPQPDLHIRGDKDVRYERVAQAMASAQQAGLRKIGFITEPKR